MKLSLMQIRDCWLYSFGGERSRGHVSYIALRLLMMIVGVEIPEIDTHGLTRPISNQNGANSNSEWQSKS